MADLDRVRALVRELHRELGLAEPPKKVRIADTRYEDGERGGVSGSWQIDIDEDGNEIDRRFLAKLNITRGMKSTED